MCSPSTGEGGGGLRTRCQRRWLVASTCACYWGLPVMRHEIYFSFLPCLPCRLERWGQRGKRSANCFGGGVCPPALSRTLAAPRRTIFWYCRHVCKTGPIWRQNGPLSPPSVNYELHVTCIYSENPLVATARRAAFLFSSLSLGVTCGEARHDVVHTQTVVH